MLSVNENPRLSHLSCTLYATMATAEEWLIINQLVQNFCEGRTGFHMICTYGHLTVILGRGFLYKYIYTTNSLAISKQVVQWKDSAVKRWSLIRLWWNFVLEPFGKMSMNLAVLATWTVSDKEYYLVGSGIVYNNRTSPAFQRKDVCLKHCWTSARLHGIMSQTIVLFIVTGMRTLSP
jgi:hypothetical protein